MALTHHSLIQDHEHSSAQHTQKGNYPTAPTHLNVPPAFSPGLPFDVTAAGQEEKRVRGVKRDQMS